MDNLNDSLLKKHLKSLSAGDHLIQEGDMGNTSFMVMEGSLLLYQKAKHANRLVGSAHAGELVGEAAVIHGTPQRRTYSVQAKTACTLLELDPESWKLMQSKMPDLTHKMAKMLSARLSRANEIIGILQAKDDAERVIQFILYNVHHFGKKVSDGVEITLSAEEMNSLLAVETEMVQSAMKTLASEKILLPKGGAYILRDENALAAFVSHLREQLAA
jgi:CRP-like cAMP-binding protein